VAVVLRDYDGAHSHVWGWRRLGKPSRARWGTCGIAYSGARDQGFGSFVAGHGGVLKNPMRLSSLFGVGIMDIDLLSQVVGQKASNHKKEIEGRVKSYLFWALRDRLGGSAFRLQSCSGEVGVVAWRRGHSGGAYSQI